MNGTAPFFALTTNCTNYTNYSTAVCQLIINSCNSWFGNFFIVLTHPLNAKGKVKEGGYRIYWLS